MKPLETPKYTICIPVFNGASTLKETLDCCAKLPKSLVRVVVSDNGSTDGTHAIAQAFADRFLHISVYRRRSNNYNAGNSYNFL